MEFDPIGIIHSPHHTKDDCPIQPAYASEAEGRVEVFAEFAAGLQDVETSATSTSCTPSTAPVRSSSIRPTFLDDAPHGVFSSRHPCRPNGIGLSIVRLARTPGQCPSRRRHRRPGRYAAPRYQAVHASLRRRGVCLNGLGQRSAVAHQAARPRVGLLRSNKHIEQARSRVAPEVSGGPSCSCATR